MPLAQVNGINVHYETSGQGEPLLLINGLGQPSISWQPELISALAAAYRVITFDNRGTGLTDKPDEPGSIATFAQDAVGLLDALGIAKAHVFGVSMGGMIGQELGAHHGARVGALILGCTTPGGGSSVPAPPESLKALGDRSSMTAEEAVRSGWKLSYSEEFIRTRRDVLETNLARTLAQPTPRFAYDRQLQATMTLRVFSHLKNITAPTLVVTGSDDVLIPAANSEIIAREVPGAELQIFAGHGHGFFVSAREELLAVMKAFLAKHPLATSAARG